MQLQRLWAFVIANEACGQEDICLLLCQPQDQAAALHQAQCLSYAPAVQEK